MNPLQIGIGVLLGLAAGGIAYAAGALTRGGGVAAALVGAVTFGLGGWLPSVLLLAFFISSSVLTRRGSRHKRRLAGHMQKGGPRDEWQVLANGALAAVFAAGFGLTGRQPWLVALTGALAASTADTWATELGVLATRRPWLVTSWRPVEAGTSGAVSLNGSLAALGGAALLGSVGGALMGGLAAAPAAAPRLALSATLGGLTGAFFDSLLGATLQASYHCPRCGQQTEHHPIHTCGTATELVHGWRWLGNDQINLLASIVGASVALAIWISLN